MFAFAAMEILQDLVSDPKPFKVNDADVFIAVFPDLALLKFQRHEVLEIRLSGFWFAERR